LTKTAVIKLKVIMYIELHFFARIIVYGQFTHNLRINMFRLVLYEV